MPVSQTSTAAPGESSSRNRLGIGLRTLSGVFDVATTYTDYGLPAYITDPANTFLAGDTVVLSSSNLPAYTLLQGSLARVRFTGIVTWDTAVGTGETIDLGIRISPTSTTTSSVYPFQLLAASAGPGVVEVFSGQVELLGISEESDDADVGMVTQYTPLASPGSGSQTTIVPLTTSTPAAKSNGIIGLQTSGYSTGTELEIVATMSNTPAANSVRVIKLTSFVVELAG